MKLGYVIVYVQDVPASLAFYERAFGLERKFLHESNQYGELDTGGTTLSFANETLIAAGGILARPNRRAAEPAGAEVGLLTDDVTAAFERAVAAGALPAAEPVRKPWGQTVAYVRDLDGFLVELCTPMG